MGAITGKFAKRSVDNNRKTAYNTATADLTRVRQGWHARAAITVAFFVTKKGVTTSMLNDRGASFSYSNAGTNTLTQVDAGPVTLFHIGATNTGGSVGYLHIYNNGSADAGAGTPDITFPIRSGTEPQEISFDPYGVQLDGGLSYLWAVGATGTVAHGVNLNLNIAYKGTATYA